MHGPIDNHDEVHSMSERGSPPPTTNTRMTGSGVSAEEESPAIVILSHETETPSSRAREVRRLLDSPPS